MKRIHALLALIAVISLTIAGCGGGGGGGGGSTPTTVTLIGRVLNSSGTAVSGVTVSIITGTRATITGTTNSSGIYSIANVPLGVSFDVSASGGGITTQSWTAIILNGTVSGSSARMEIALQPDAPPAGSTIEILPDISQIALGTTPIVTVRVKDDIGTVLHSNYQALWTVVGNVPTTLLNSSPYYGKALQLTGDAVGHEARVTATVLLADGSTASDTMDVEVVSDDVEPPPPPPGF